MGDDVSDAKAFVFVSFGEQDWARACMGGSSLGQYQKGEDAHGQDRYKSLVSLPVKWNKRRESTLEFTAGRNEITVQSTRETVEEKDEVLQDLYHRLQTLEAQRAPARGFF